MPEVPQVVHGSGEQPAGIAQAREATWLGDLTVFGPDGSVLGWAERWGFHSTLGLDLVVIPRLHLAQKTVYRLVHVRGYRDVFAGGMFCGPGLSFAPFQIYGADFPFYKTGRPEIHRVVTTLEGVTVNLSEIIQVATELLT